MKKSRLIVSILLTIVLILSMTACVQDKPTPTPSPSTSTTTTTTTTGPVVTPTPTTSTPSKPAHNIDWQPGGSSKKTVDADDIVTLEGNGTYYVNEISTDGVKSFANPDFAGTIIFGKIDIGAATLTIDTPNATVVFTDEVKASGTTVSASLNTTKVEGNAKFGSGLTIAKGNLVVTAGTLATVTIPVGNTTITSVTISGGEVKKLAPAKAVTVTIENAPKVAIAPTAKIIIEQKSSSSKVTLDLTDGSAGALIKPSAGAAQIELPTAQAGKVEVELTGNTTVDDVLSKPSTEGDETNFDAATSLKTSTLDVPFIFSEAEVTAWKSGDAGIIFDGNFAEVVFKGTLSQDQMAAIAAIGEPAADIPLYIKIKLPSSVTDLNNVTAIKTYGTKSDAVGSTFDPPDEEGRIALLTVETEKYLLLKPGRYVADNINGYWELKDNLQDFAVSYKIGNDTYKVKINLLNPPTITKGDTADFTDDSRQNLAAAINDPAIKKINVNESMTLKANATLAAGKTLTIADGKMLTIAAGVTFNPGSFDVLANKGKITNHGTIVGFDITGTGLNVAARHDAGVLADGQPTQVNDDKFTVGEPIFTAKDGAANAKIEFTITVTDILTEDFPDQNPEHPAGKGEWIGTRIKLPSIKDITTVQFSKEKETDYDYLAKDTAIAEADQKDSFMHYENAKETDGVITRYLKDYNGNIVELIVTVEYADNIKIATTKRETEGVTGTVSANTNLKEITREGLISHWVLDHEKFTGDNADAIRTAAQTYLTETLGLSTVQIVAFPKFSDELAAKNVVMKVIGIGSVDGLQLFGADSGGDVYDIVKTGYWGPDAGVTLGSRPAFANLPKLKFFAGGKAGTYTFKLAFVEVDETGVTDTVLAETAEITITNTNTTTYTAPVE